MTYNDVFKEMDRLNYEDVPSWFYTTYMNKRNGFDDSSDEDDSIQTLRRNRPDVITTIDEDDDATVETTRYSKQLATAIVNQFFEPNNHTHAVAQVPKTQPSGGVNDGINTERLIEV